MTTAALSQRIGETIRAMGPMPRKSGHANTDLVRRVNQLYHDLTQDVFDAEHRNRHRVEKVFWRQVVQHCLTRDVAAGRTVVDLACGTGFEARILTAAMVSTDRLVAVDISSSALASTARKCGSPQLVATVGDGSALPLPGESVDLFAINAALHHMPDPAAVLAEVHRVLKPAGWFALGHEPNLRHFSSPMATVSRGIDRLAWYASPRQNLRRLRSRLGMASGDRRADENDFQVARTINRKLMEDGSIQDPLTVAEILDLVDPHARGADEHAGFDAARLMGKSFPGYEQVRLVSSDYLGEAARRLPAIRAVADAALRTVWADHGSLFSFLLRKPDRAGGC